MRKILFRSWDKKRKILAFVSQIDFSIQKIIYKHPIDVWGVDDERVLIREHFHKIILMQYIESKDCEGNKIFEGDILEIIDSNGDKHIIEVEEKGKIEFDRDVLESGEITLIEWLPEDWSYRIIGNIYENPELMEKIK